MWSRVEHECIPRLSSICAMDVAPKIAVETSGLACVQFHHITNDRTCTSQPARLRGTGANTVQI
jgi:hypothetical protein